MSSPNPDHIRAVIKTINKGLYFKHISMTVKEMGVGYSIVELKAGSNHLNPLGHIHGGVYASIIDTAAYWATYCELQEKVGLISIDLKIDFLASIRSGVIIAKGRSIKVGKSICLAEAIATDKDDKLLALGTSKLMVMKRSQTIEEAIIFTGCKAFPPKFI